MPAPATKIAAALVLACGDDEYSVKQRTKQIYQQWCAELGGMDHEIIDAQVSNSGEALTALARLREALQTLPFFGSAKAIWFQNCNFLGDERTASAQAVTESLTDLAQELKQFSWDNVRLLISAGKVDKRKVFFKTIEKIGAVESFTAWSIDDKDWAIQAESAARRLLNANRKEISDEPLDLLVSYIGPNARLLNNEIEKLVLYVGGRTEITVEDVEAIVTRTKQARAFALGDALGDRDLPRLLRCLDNELWELKLDSQKSEIGLLYGLITKVRVLIFLKEMLREKWIKQERDYQRFKAQLERVPVDQLPEDRRFNPLAMNAYVLFKAMSQVQNYSIEELVKAMHTLLECNQQLIFSRLDEALVLQQALVEIARGNGPRPVAGGRVA